MKIKTVEDLVITNGEVVLTLPLDITPYEFLNQSGNLTFWYGDPESGVLPKNHIYKFKNKNDTVNPNQKRFGSVKFPQRLQIFSKE